MSMEACIPKVPDLRLVLMRHSKSDYPPGVTDDGRPLSQRGRRDAAALGRFLADSGFLGEKTRVIVSSAKRTQETWEIAGGGNGKITEPRLYEATTETILDVIQSTPNEVWTLIVLAHNPGIMAASMFLCDNPQSPDFQRLAKGFPTSGAAVFRVPTWSEVGEDSATLQAFVVPRGS